MYQKEIVYMSLFDQDMKRECVGYLKLEKKQDDFRLELQVKNLPDALAGNFPIRLQGEEAWREADMIAIKDGSGKWTGRTAEEVLRAEIILPDSYKIRGQSKKAPSIPEHRTELSNETEEAQTQNAEEQLSKPVLPVKAVSIVQTEQPAPEKYAPIKQSMPVKQSTPLYESKWEQILATYEKTRPYGDDRIYVKLEPKDFIVLRSNYQHLVNNSFLLHGFYNYRHLILGKEKDFYLGVPGVFYEREKMVALMFGFEAFECEGGEAEEGKFGYYLRKVEI